MGGKRNKKRYVRDDTPKKTITISGAIGLQYVDEEQLDVPKKGDLACFPNCDELHDSHIAEYESTGFSGYFKVDIWDGRQWCPVVLAELFPAREHYFKKSDRPIDVYHLCYEILAELAGKDLTRTYREHYELVLDEE